MSIAVAIGVLGVPDPAPASNRAPATAAPEISSAPAREIQLRAIGTAATTASPRSGTARCPDGKSTELRIERAGQLVSSRSLAEAMGDDGSIEIASGRHRGQRGLPLATVLAEHAGVTAVQLVPCEGDIETIAAADLRAEPGAIVLVLNSRRISKVVDLAAGGARGPLVKNLAAIRLLP